METSQLICRVNIVGTCHERVKDYEVNLCYETFIIFLEILNIALWRI